MYGSLIKHYADKICTDCNNAYAKAVTTYVFDEKRIETLIPGYPYRIMFIGKNDIFDMSFVTGDVLNVILVEKSSERLVFITGTQLHEGDSKYCNVFELTPEMGFTLTPFDLVDDSIDDDE